MATQSPIPGSRQQQLKVKYSLSLGQGSTPLVTQDPSRGLGNLDVLNQDDKAKTRSACWGRQSSEDCQVPEHGATTKQWADKNAERIQAWEIDIWLQFSPQTRLETWNKVSAVQECEGKGSGRISSCEKQSDMKSQTGWQPPKRDQPHGPSAAGVSQCRYHYIPETFFKLVASVHPFW